MVKKDTLVQFYAKPKSFAGFDQLVCANENTKLSVENPISNQTYTWKNGLSSTQGNEYSFNPSKKLSGFISR